MTLNELCATLPNGLHDAAMHAVTVDYRNRQVRLDLSIWVGDLTDEDGTVREEHKDAEVVFYDFVFYAVEPPDPFCPRSMNENVTIDTGDVQSLEKSPAMKLPSVPEGAFVNWIFVFEWNSFIYVAANDVRLQWREEGT